MPVENVSITLQQELLCGRVIDVDKRLNQIQTFMEKKTLESRTDALLMVVEQLRKDVSLIKDTIVFLEMCKTK